jgi:hypothetical protein
MPEGWTCSRCSTVNAADRFGCSNCGLLRHDAATVGSSAPAAWPGTPTEPATVEASEQTTTAGVAAEYPTSSEAAYATSPGVVTGVVPDGDHGDYGTAAPASKPLWQRIPVGWLIFAVLIAGGAITGWYFNASRSTTGEITKAGDMTAGDLRVGDCFDLKDPAANEIEDVTAGPCTSAHEFEMFFVGTMPGSEFPAETAFEAYVNDNCGPAFGAYVGKPYADSELSMYWLAPTAEGWRAGDHSVQCAVYHQRVHVQTQSLKGSNQ